jgi:lipopolysaccharide export system permease protein
MRINLLDKASFKFLSKSMLVHLSLMMFILLMFQGLRLAEYLVIHGASFKTVAQIAVSLSVALFPVVLPLAFLFAALSLCAKGYASGEWLGAESLGFSRWRLQVPSLIFAFLVVIFCAWGQWSLGPRAENLSKHLLFHLSAAKMTAEVQEGTFIKHFFDLLIYAEKRDPATRRLEGVFIFDERDKHAPLTLVAKSAQFESHSTEQSLTLVLFDGSMQRLSPKSTEETRFKTYKLRLHSKFESSLYTKKPRLLEWEELRERRVREPAAALEAEYWRRLHGAWLPFVYLVTAGVWGKGQRRQSSAEVFLLGFFLVFVSWLGQIAGVLLASDFGYSPMWALLLPQALLLGLSYLRSRQVR